MNERAGEDLTPRQWATVKAIAAHVGTWGRPPTLREIGTALGIGSTNGVCDHLRALERKGYVIRDSNVSRGLWLTPRARHALRRSAPDDAPIWGVEAGPLERIRLHAGASCE